MEKTDKLPQQLIRQRTKDNHHLPAVNELSHLFGLAQALQGFSASSAPRLRDRVKDRSKSSCPSATQVQISTMPGLESSMNQMFVFLCIPTWWCWSENDTEKFHPSFWRHFIKAIQIQIFWKLNLYVLFGAFGSYKVTVPEKFQKNPKKS